LDPIKEGSEEMTTKPKTEIIDGREKVFLLEVTCFRVEDWEKPQISHIIDDSGDPNFYCANCYEEHNHTHYGKVGEYKNQGDKHKVRLLGSITIQNLRLIVLTEPELNVRK